MGQHWGNENAHNVSMYVLFAPSLTLSGFSTHINVWYLDILQWLYWDTIVSWFSL